MSQRDFFEHSNIVIEKNLSDGNKEIFFERKARDERETECTQVHEDLSEELQRNDRERDRVNVQAKRIFSNTAVR